MTLIPSHFRRARVLAVALAALAMSVLAVRPEAQQGGAAATSSGQAAAARSMIADDITPLQQLTQAVRDSDATLAGGGGAAEPGTYYVTLDVGGKKYTKPLQILQDRWLNER